MSTEESGHNINHETYRNGFSSGDSVDNQHAINLDLTTTQDNPVVVMTNSFLEKVLTHPDDFSGAHSSFVRELGRDQNARLLAIKAVIEWSLQPQNDNYYSDSELFSKRADTGAKTLQQLFVRYHGLAPNSPYGPYLFDLLRQNVQCENVNSQSELLITYGVNVCLTTCELILGHDAFLLDECVNTLEKLISVNDDGFTTTAAAVTSDSTNPTETAEVVAETVSSTIPVGVVVNNDNSNRQQVLIQCMWILNRFENLLNTAPTRGPTVANIFSTIRYYLINHKLPAGEVSELALTMLEKKAIRHHLTTVVVPSHDNNDSHHVQMNGYIAQDDAIFADYCSMDEEAEADYEKFLEECL